MSLLSLSIIGSFAIFGEGSAAELNTGWRSPTTQGDDAPHGTNQWASSASNIFSQDDVAAFTGSQSAAHGLGHFGFTFEPDAAISGVEVGFDAWTRNPANNTCRLDIRIWRASRPGSSTTSKWAAVQKQTTLTKTSDDDQYQIVGGSNDLWGDTGWRVSDFSDANFAIEIRFADPGSGCDTGGGNGIAVDHIQVRVHYTTPEPAELPDLTVTKDATRNGAPISSITEDQDFRWRWRISNEGEADAVFQTGEVVLRDELPDGLVYSSPSSSTGLTCGVADEVFTCIANGTLTIPVDGTVQVSLAADPSAAGSYTNLATDCKVDDLADDSDGNLDESDETNNSCQADVTVQVIKLLHPRVCVRLVDDDDAFAGEAATISLAFENVTAGTAAGGSTKDYAEASESDPMAAAECSDLNYFTVGTVIKVTASVTSPVDATIAAGYPIAKLIPGVDPDPPSSEVEFTVGDGTCGGPTNGEAVIANGTCNLHLYVKLVPSLPPTELPTIRKATADPPIVDGKARWNITVDQPDENWAEQTVTITDAHSDIELVGGPPCTVDAGEIVCSIGEHDVTLTVTRPINAQTLASGTLCAGGTISNHLVSATADDDALLITAGETPVAIDVRDTSTCAAPMVTKMLVPNALATVSDPHAVRWLITLSNPVDGLDGVAVSVRDLDAVLIAGGGATNPEGNLDAWCSVTSAPAFEADCTLPADAIVTFVVAPSAAPPLQCANATYPNTAESSVGDEAEWSSVPGPTITLLGAQSECPQDITIVKRLVNVPQGQAIDPVSDLPTLTVPEGTYVAGPTALGGGEYAWVYTVPPRYSGTVTESVPPGWEAVPCESGSDGAFTTFCNQPLASISVTKVYEPNGGADATDDDMPLSILLDGHGVFVPAEPTLDNVTTYQTKPVPAGRYTVTESLSPLWHLSDINVAGNGCQEVRPEDLFESIEQELVRGIQLAHLETSITFDAQPGADCQLTFTNERLVATVVVQKVYVGSAGDAPSIAVKVDGNSADGDWEESGAPTDKWERLIPVANAGSSVEVTEMIPAGWANAGAFVGSCESKSAGSPAPGISASVVAETVRPGETVTFCFVNVAVGNVQLIKLDSAQTGAPQTWNFASTAPGVAGSLTTADADGTSQAQATFELVPAGEYTISELQGRGECAPGALSSNFQTQAAARVGAPPEDGDVTPVVGAGALSFTVEKGATTYVRFDNRGCGTVLGTGTIVIWKFADFDGDGVRDGYEPPVPGWKFAIDGPDGSFDVIADSQGRHVFTVAKGGVYSISEEIPEGWLAIGSVQNGKLTPGTIAQVQAGLGQHREVAFFNQPRVNIAVTKTEISSSAPSGAPGEGWEFSLTGCDIEPRVDRTDANGELLFEDLPPAVGCSYTIAETQVEGWLAVTLSRTVSPEEPGETVTIGFRNIRFEICDDCTTVGPQPGTTPSPTPTNTAPPLTPMPVTPTMTSTSVPSPDPGSTPGPGITAIAGERTPGPAGTPLPPDTGQGNSTGGGASLLLWLAGSAAVATGLLLLRAGRLRPS